MEQYKASRQRPYLTGTLCALALTALAACHSADGNPSGQANNAIKGAGTCASPIVLAGGAALDNESTTKAADTLSADSNSCLNAATHGADQVYKVTIPGADQAKLTVTVTPQKPPGADAFDPVVYLTEDCGAQPVACKAAADDRGGGSPEAISYVNTSGLAKDVFVIVDGYDFQPSGGDYKIAADLAAP